MITPTNEQIDRLCAEACGYSIVHTKSMPIRYFIRFPSGHQSDTYNSERQAVQDLPDFCEDRNALPDLLAVVGTAGAAEAFADCLGYKTGDSGLIFLESHDVLSLLCMPTRTIAIAALKALDKWQSDWSTEEPEK